MNWYEIGLLVLAVVLLLSGGYIRKLTKEMKELVDTFSAAIADDEVTKEELDAIIKEATDVKDVVVEIAELLFKKKGS